MGESWPWSCVQPSLRSVCTHDLGQDFPIQTSCSVNNNNNDNNINNNNNNIIIIIIIIIVVMINLNLETFRQAGLSKYFMLFNFLLFWYWNLTI